MTLTKKTFREFAKRAIAKYEARDMPVDAMLWSQIIGYYEAALPVVDPKKPDKCNCCKGTGRVKRKRLAHVLAISRAHMNRAGLVDQARVVRAVVGAEER